jgi:hypothetical protein
MTDLTLEVLDPTSTTRAVAVLPEQILDEEAQECVSPHGNSRQWVDELVSAGHVSEAVRVLALVLPKKYALAWGCECLRVALSRSVSDSREVDRAGIVLTERWLANPTEDHRRAALEFAERGKFDTAGAWIAAAAGWAEGSMGPKDLEQVVAPPESLTGEAVVAALLTFALSDADATMSLLSEFVQRALRTFGGVVEGAVA